ncbi:MAG: hypothetical protein PVI30_16360 [Myxococcales bacterium]|jgi:hypothetical protein
MDDSSRFPLAADRVADAAQEGGTPDASEPTVSRRSTSAPPPSMSSTPPGPRVDMALWVVLALGLFAIAGGMIVYAL